MSNKSKKIILIEDSSVDTFLIQRILREHPCASSHQLISFDNLTDAISKIKELGDEVELILLDLNLPDTTDAVDTYTQTRNANARVPIVALTGLESNNLALNLLSLGLEDYIWKSHLMFTPESLRRTIDYSLCHYNHNQICVAGIEKTT